MKGLLFSILILVFGGVSCIEHEKENKLEFIKKPIPKIEVKYAKGFEVEYKDGFVIIRTHSFSENETFADSIYLVFDNKVKIADNSKTVFLNKNSRLACQSSTHLAYLNVLFKLKNVCGLCGLDYVTNPETLDSLINNDVKELCLTGQVQLEALYATESNLFLRFPFGNTQDDIYAKNGIKSLLIAEYLEETQLARLEWIKLFGLLVGEVELANNYFNKVEKEYLDLVQKTKGLNKTFIMNLPFKDNWFMPTEKSVGVQLIKDSGLDYYYQNELGTENSLHSKEAVWQDGTMADYWIIIALRPPNFSLVDLLKEEEVYKEFLSVKNKHVIFCNVGEVDYFAEGIVEPNIVLKDLLFATGQISNHQPKYFHVLD